jgi:cation transport protein ChaC
VPALVYLADRAHRQFAGKLPLAKALSWCARARRHRHQHRVLRNTLAHLRELGLRRTWKSWRGAQPARSVSAAA